MPRSGTDFDVNDGGFGITGEKVLEDEVRVGSGTVGGVDESGAVKRGEEGERNVVVVLVGRERGVKRQFRGAASVVLERFVELSRIIDERA